MSVLAEPQLRALIPQKSVAVVLLVENSLAMSNMWNEVRRHYLAALGARLQLSNENHTTSMATILLESTSNESAGRAGTSPRRCSNFSNALESVKFCPNPRNMITSGLISECIDILSSSRIPGHPSTLHLIIVAASPVYAGISTRSQGSVRSPQQAWWDKQAHRLKEAGIRCHLIYRPSQDMSSLISLFNAAMKMQNLVEETLPPPPTSATVELSMSKMVVRMAMPKSGDTSGGESLPVGEGEATPSTSNLNSQAGPFRSPNLNPTCRVTGSKTHGEFSGRPSYHPTSNYDSTPPTLPPEVSAKSPRAPSIVARLQQVHGLTKKKLYGSTSRTPPYTPYFKDERVDGIPQEASLQSLIPPEVQEYINHNYPRSNSAGKAPARSRGDRRSRPAQRSATSPPCASRRDVKRQVIPDQSLQPPSPSSSYYSTPLPPLSSPTGCGPPLASEKAKSTTAAPLVIPHSHPQGSHASPDGLHSISSGVSSQPQSLASSPFSPNIIDLPTTQTTDFSDPCSLLNTSLGPSMSRPFAGPLGTAPNIEHQHSTIHSAVTDSWTIAYTNDMNDVQPNLCRWGETAGTAQHLSSAYVEGSGGSMPGGMALGEECILPETVPFQDTGANQIPMKQFYTDTDRIGIHYGYSPPFPSVADQELHPTNTTLSATVGSDASTGGENVTSQSTGLDCAPAIDPGTQQPSAGVTVNPYEFHHYSSSSLSAMINPSLATFSPQRSAGNATDADCEDHT